MEGLSIKKVVIIAIFGALIGSALVPLAAMPQNKWIEEWHCTRYEPASEYAHTDYDMVEIVMAENSPYLCVERTKVQTRKI